MRRPLGTHCKLSKSRVIEKKYGFFFLAFFLRGRMGELSYTSIEEALTWSRALRSRMRPFSTSGPIVHKSSSLAGSQQVEVMI
jgi:hypothetical protein